MYIHNIVRIALPKVISSMAEPVLSLWQTFPGSMLFAALIIAISIVIILLMRKIPGLRQLV